MNSPNGTTFSADAHEGIDFHWFLRSTLYWTLHVADFRFFWRFKGQISFSDLPMTPHVWVSSCYSWFNLKTRSSPPQNATYLFDLKSFQHVQVWHVLSCIRLKRRLSLEEKDEKLPSEYSENSAVNYGSHRQEVTQNSVVVGTYLFPKNNFPRHNSALWTGRTSEMLPTNQFSFIKISNSVHVRISSMEFHLQQNTSHCNWSLLR